MNNFVIGHKYRIVADNNSHRQSIGKIFVCDNLYTTGYNEPATKINGWVVLFRDVKLVDVSRAEMESQLSEVQLRVDYLKETEKDSYDELEFRKWLISKGLGEGPDINKIEEAILGEDFDIESYNIPREHKINRGQYYRLGRYIYLLAQTGPSKLALVCLDDGRRWKEPVTVEDVLNVSDREWSAICGYATTSVSVNTKQLTEV